MHPVTTDAACLLGRHPQAPPVRISAICGCAFLRNTDEAEVKKATSMNRRFPKLSNTILYVDFRPPLIDFSHHVFRPRQFLLCF